MRVFRHITSKIAGDATLTPLIYGAWLLAAPADAIPTEPTKPWVIYQQQSPLEDVTVINAARIYTPGLYLIKAVGPARLADAVEAVANELDALFQPEQGAAVLTSTLVAMYRTQALTYGEAVGGVEMIHTGGLYWAGIQ